MTGIRSALVWSLKQLDRWVILPAPIVLAAVSGYLLFVVILPFHLLAIDKVPTTRIDTGEVSLGHALGEPAAAIGFVLEIILWTMTWVWVLSLVNVIRTRKWYVLVVLALSPLVFAYYNAGPYAWKIKYWVETL